MLPHLGGVLALTVGGDRNKLPQWILLRVFYRFRHRSWLTDRQEQVVAPTCFEALQRLASTGGPWSRGARRGCNGSIH
jgi:hypothetical protein